MDNKKKMILAGTLMAAALLMSSCGKDTETAQDGPVTTPAVTETATATEPAEMITEVPGKTEEEPSYTRITFTGLSEGTVKDGHVSITGYVCASDGGAVLADLPGVCETSFISPVTVILDESGTPVPAGKEVTVKGTLRDRVLTVESAVPVDTGWNRFADIYAVYSGRSFTEAYTGYDAYMVTLCTWQYMAAGETGTVNPEQALAMLSSYDAGSFTDDVIRASKDCGKVGEIFGEYAEAVQVLEKKALDALENGGYSFDEASGVYMSDNGEDYGSSYGATRRRLRESLAGLIKAE